MSKDTQKDKDKLVKSDKDNESSNNNHNDDPIVPLREASVVDYDK